MNSLDGFKKTMQVANNGRPVFVPIVYRLAARIEQTPLFDMVSDPTIYTNVLEGAFKLLNQDAIITSFDPTLEAEIFGCRVEWQFDYDLPAVSGWMEREFSGASLENSHRLAVLLESTKRLIQTRGREVAIVGVMTGPCSLSRDIAANAAPDREYPFEEIVALAGGQLSKYARGLGELKVDSIIIREDLLGEKYYEEFLAHEKAYTAAYATLFNLTRFYNLAGLLMVKGGKLEDLAVIVQKLSPSGLMLTCQELDESGLNFLKNLSNSRKMAIGLPLPLTEPDKAAARLQVYEDFILKNKPGGFFYTSEGEVPPDISLENLRDIAGRIKGTTKL
jgi:hypothetical protein